jgi:hypothetical protein
MFPGLPHRKHPPNTVMLGSQPAQGRWWPIASCLRCHQLVRLYDARGAGIGHLEIFEWKAIRVLLAPTANEMTEHQAIAREGVDWGHDCFDPRIDPRPASG